MGTVYVPMFRWDCNPWGGEGDWSCVPMCVSRFSYQLSNEFLFYTCLEKIVVFMAWSRAANLQSANACEKKKHKKKEDPCRIIRSASWLTIRVQVCSELYQRNQCQRVPCLTKRSQRLTLLDAYRCETVPGNCIIYTRWTLVGVTMAKLTFVVCSTRYKGSTCRATK